jgi:hypothetical protein
MNILKYNFQITQRNIITNLGNIILLYKPITNSTSSNKTQHSHL